MQEFLNEKNYPYICTPLTGKNKEEIMKELCVILPKNPDVIEWRADFLEKLNDHSYVFSILDEIADQTDLPLLFTIRSAHEGGEPIALTEEEKVNLIGEICKNDAVWLIDYEVSSYPEHIKKLREISKAEGKKLILSYHNFKCTPSNEEILKKLFQAEFYGADIAKAAVMPLEKADVLRLLTLTNEADHSLDIPLITMSMGSLGVLSRIIGWTYGSMLTFGVGVKTSAPGQVPIEQLQQFIALTKEAMQEE